MPINSIISQFDASILLPSGAPSGTSDQRFSARASRPRAHHDQLKLCSSSAQFIRLNPKMMNTRVT
jgi:hypothetical protein